MLTERKEIDLRKFRIFIQKNNSYPNNIQKITLFHNLHSRSKSSSELVMVNDKMKENNSDEPRERNQKLQSKTEKYDKSLFIHNFLNHTSKKQINDYDYGNKIDNLNQSFNKSMFTNFYLGHMGGVRHNPKCYKKIQLKNYSFRSLSQKKIKNRNLSSMNQTVFNHFPNDKKLEKLNNNSTRFRSSNKKLKWHEPKKEDEIENEEEIHFLFVKLYQKKKHFYSNLSFEAKLLNKSLTHNDYYAF